MLNSLPPHHAADESNRCSEYMCSKDRSRRVALAALFAFTLVAPHATAQQLHAAHAGRISGHARAAWVSPVGQHSTTSITLGGFAIGKSRLALAKLEQGIGQWAVVLDVTRDALTEDWSTTDTQQASRGAYRMWAGSATLRRYARQGARGFFVEAGGGAASARLAVTDAADTRTVRTARIPLGTWGAGARISLGATRTFAELGVRSAIPLSTRHLDTDSEPSAGSTRDNVSYRSWYFERAKPSSQLYAGLGVSF